MKTKRFDPFKVMTENGWKWLQYNEKGSWRDECVIGDTNADQYVMEILSDMYSVAVRAVVASRPEHLKVAGKYGVLWVDVVEYEIMPPYGRSDLEDMQYALELAEDNLLRIGIPFGDSKDLHGRNAANKRRRNEKLRRLYDLDEMEKKEGY